MLCHRDQSLPGPKQMMPRRLYRKAVSLLSLLFGLSETGIHNFVVCTDARLLSYCEHHTRGDSDDINPSIQLSINKIMSATNSNEMHRSHGMASRGGSL